jgi:glycosyltransferase involved in cell wall biosynthesis
MLISVIIPFKNSEKYIKQSVNSVINQSLSNKYYEIIAVNDRSRDTSNKIVKGIIHNKPNCKLLSTNRDTVGPGI